MADARREYEAALAAFAAKGNRYATLGRLTYWGRAAGLALEAVTADARACGVANRDADIRRNWATAKPRLGADMRRNWACASVRSSRGGAARTVEPAHGHRGIVRELVEAGRRELGGLDGTAATRAAAGLLGGLARAMPPRDQCAAQFRALFAEGETVEVRASKAARRERAESTRTARDWLALPCGIGQWGELATVNPVVPWRGGGSARYVNAACVAAWRHALVEYDGMGLADQCRLWIGYLLAPPESLPPLVSLVYSGGKSIHGVVRIGAASAADFAAKTGELLGLLGGSTGDGSPDGNALRCPIVGTRLAGATRRDTGREQKLIYLRGLSTFPQSR